MAQSVQNLISVISVLFILLVHSCADKTKNSTVENARYITYVDPFEPPSDSLVVWRNLAYLGDIYSYNKLRTFYLKSPKYRSQDLLPYAIRMANKYGNQDANYDVYLACSGFSHSEFNSRDFDSVTLGLIKFHLANASKYGNKQAEEYYQRFFKGSSLPTSGENYHTIFVYT